jgi:hypothetical protein
MKQGSETTSEGCTTSPDGDQTVDKSRSQQALDSGPGGDGIEVEVEKSQLLGLLMQSVAR